ncbi:MAG: cytoplasmic protein [Desulfobacter sp.]|nr:cytoplasmic protein [Desulfobacter sp.]WDP85869.1 MAG: cytoplasmic protein [Desulfobacter sp.]
MNDNGGSPNSIDFLVDKDHLFREQTITDLKIATIRQLIPIKADGSDDADREPIFIGSTQLGTPQGPIPMQAKLEAATLGQAMDAFPQAMEEETKKVVENLKRMHEQQKKSQDSRIIMPGMQ